MGRVMVDYDYWYEGGLHRIKASPPFHFKELYTLGARALMRGGKPAEFWRPTLFDFRKVQIKELDTTELLEILAKRSSFGEKHKNNPSAYLVRDLNTHAMMRMAAAYADAHGLRDENQTIVTNDADEATQWLASEMALQAEQTERLRAFVG